jgi:hypothetical protein
MASCYVTLRDGISLTFILRIKWVPGVFPGVKAAGVWRRPPTTSSAEVKERVDLYLYSPSGPVWPVLG